MSFFFPLSVYLIQNTLSLQSLIFWQNFICLWFGLLELVFVYHKKMSAFTESFARIKIAIFDLYIQDQGWA